jgi:DNA repair photolyase
MFKPIYEPKSKAKEYCDLAINIYTGYNHKCTYCYAKKMHDRYRPNENFDDVKVREGIVEATKKQLAGGKYIGKKIMLCFMCDPYPADIDTTATREIITAIKEAGANFTVLTKGAMRAARDFDLYKPGDSFGASLTLLPHNHYAHYWEPEAPSNAERCKSLLKAHEKGIRTWASLEPVIFPEDTLRIIEMTHEYVDLYKVGVINYNEKKKYIDWKDFGHKAIDLLESLGKEYYIKDDLKAYL